MTQTLEKLKLVGDVKFYSLDAPFGKATAEFDSKGKLTNGKFSVTMLVEAGDPETEKVIKAIGKNKSISSEMIGGKGYHKVTASTAFKVTMVNAEGVEIDAPADVRVNKGDTMKMAILVKPYEGTFAERNDAGETTGKKLAFSGLNLNAAKILSHDTSNRVETAEEGSAKEDFLNALN